MKVTPIFSPSIIKATFLVTLPIGVSKLLDFLQFFKEKMASASFCSTTFHRGQLCIRYLVIYEHLPRTYCVPGTVEGIDSEMNERVYGGRMTTASNVKLLKK